MYYNTSLPDVGDIVFVNYIGKSDTGLGVYVELIEYDNKDGLILSTEIAPGKRAVRPEKLFTQSKYFPCHVLCVDKEKGSIDLSYRKVGKDKIEIYEKNFANIQRILKIYKEIAKLRLHDDDDLFKKTFMQHITHQTIVQEVDVQNILTKILNTPMTFFTQHETFEQNALANYIKLIEKRTTITKAEVYQSLSLTILESDAIAKIIEILNLENVKVIYMSPQYRFYVVCKTVKECLSDVEKIKEIILQRVKKYSHLITFDEPKTLKENSINFS